MKQKRFFAMLLALCLVVSMVPNGVVAAEWSTPTIEKTIDTATYVNPLYDGPVVNRGPVSQPAGDTPPEPDVYYTDIEAAAAQMREQMVARQAQIVIGFEAESKSATLMDDIFAEAIAHTQVPEEGDYLRWNTMYWLSTRYTDVYDTYCSMIIVYEVYYYTTEEQELEMDAAVDTLLNTLDLGTASDYKKVCGVYDWICENVVYDYDNLEDDTYTLKQSSYAALVNGTSVCQGYATLLYRLLMELDVDCRVIVGDAGGSHAWNIVEMDGLYYNADSTWDASYAQAGWDYGYFLVSEAEFTDHVRDEEYLTEEFRTAYPMGEVPYGPITASGTCGDNLTWVLVDNVLTISGTGEMYDLNVKGGTPCPWLDYSETITKVIIEEGVTSIGAEAFRWHIAIEEIVIPDTVTAIGQSAIMGCINLKRLEIPAGVTEIGSFMATNCSSMTELVIPEGVTSLGRHAFSSCSSLEKVVIPSTVTWFDMSVFASCSALREVKFLGDAPQYLEMVFDGVTATVYYPADNETWTQEQINAYNNANEATLTWEPYGEALENPFTDVPEGEYYYDPVLWAVEKGVTTGTGDGSTFSPERACTRAQVVTFLWRAAGSPEPESMTHNFTDVAAGSYYEKAVIWAVESGITGGTGDGTTFSPDRVCTRAEVVTFLWRAKGQPAPESSHNPFPDVPAGSYYEKAVLWAVENSITTGKGNGNFAPTEYCTRAHVVTFLYRAFAEE